MGKSLPEKRCNQPGPMSGDFTSKPRENLTLMLKSRHFASKKNIPTIFTNKT
jgi:hypothetical protein